MRVRPWPLVLLAVFHLVSPVFSVCASSYLSNLPLSEYLRRLFAVEPKFQLALFFLAPIAAGFSIWMMKRWSHTVFLISTVIMGLVNFQSWRHYPTLVTLPLLLGVFAVNFAVVTYFLLPAVRAVYFNRRLRWWETAPRYEFRTKGDLNGGFWDSPCDLQNISRGGVFLECPRALQHGERLTITFQAFNRSFRFEGRVAHVRPGGGCGIEFLHTPESRTAARNLTQSLRTTGVPIVGRMARPEDGFQHWFLKLIRTGEGLLPEAGSMSSSPIGSHPASDGSRNPKSKSGKPAA